MVQEGAYRRGIRSWPMPRAPRASRTQCAPAFTPSSTASTSTTRPSTSCWRTGPSWCPRCWRPFRAGAGGDDRQHAWYGVRKARETIEIHSESIAKAHQAGVAIAMGTDAGVMPHGTNLRGAGLSGQRRPVAHGGHRCHHQGRRQCLGWQDRIGTLERGKLADVVVAATDPLADIRAGEDGEHCAGHAGREGREEPAPIDDATRAGNPAVRCVVRRCQDAGRSAWCIPECWRRASLADCAFRDGSFDQCDVRRADSANFLGRTRLRFTLTRHWHATTMQEQNQTDQSRR